MNYKHVISDISIKNWELSSKNTRWTSNIAYPENYLSVTHIIIPALIILSEVKQAQKAKYHVLPHMWSLDLKQMQ
jgi:hypothetical protein